MHDPARRLLNLALAQSKQACERSLFEFTRQAWHVLEPNTPYKPHAGTRAICELLEAVTRGEITRLKINLPPRHGKTKTVSEFWPVWEWISRPWLRYVFSSYGLDLSADASVHRRTLIQSTWFQERWGHLFKLKGDQNVKTHFENDKTGVMQATSTGGAVTGKGGNRVIIDDPTKVQGARQDVNLPQALREAIDFYRDVLSTRLDDPRTGAMVVIMHRLHQNDLCGHLDSHEPGRWYTLCLRGEAERGEKIVLRKRVIFRRKLGQVLDPHRFPKHVLEGMKATMGSRAYAAQVQQHPSPPEGNVIKEDWIKFWKELPATFDEVLQSWDMSFKGSETSNFVAGHVWARRGANKYLLDRAHGRMGFSAAKAAVVAMTAKWPTAHKKLVEAAANGPAIVDALKESISGLVEVQPMGSKYARLEAASVDFEAGNVFLPHSSIASWVGEVVQELTTFPASVNDDDVDAASQAINSFRKALKPVLSVPTVLPGEAYWTALR